MTVRRLLPIFARTCRLRDAPDALQVRRHMALLDAVPLVARFVALEAPLALELIVNVVARGALVDEIAFALALVRRADKADLVLGPLEMNYVAGDWPVELAPGRAVGALPFAVDAVAGLDEVEIAVKRIEINAAP